MTGTGKTLREGRTPADAAGLSLQRPALAALALAVAVAAGASFSAGSLTLLWRRGFGLPPPSAMLHDALQYGALYTAAFLLGASAGLALARLAARLVLTGAAQLASGISAGMAAAALWHLAWPRSFKSWGWLALLAGVMLGARWVFRGLRRHAPYSFARLAVTVAAALLLGIVTLAAVIGLVGRKADSPLSSRERPPGQFALPGPAPPPPP